MTSWLVKELRAIPIIVGLATLLVANRLWVINDLFDDGKFVPGLWPWWMLAGGIACLVYAFNFKSLFLLSLSGSMVVSGYLARAIAVGYQLTDGSSGLLGAQLHLAGAIYTLSAFALGVVWYRVLRPATGLLRIRDTHDDLGH